ncbi:hypothetical protein VE00_09919 [Pseudogymnoascus sp. WSF 3629]|nr:hypothetical protein VE00_09919 [Pseudogymnoascus sp. WSF 3629]
MAASVYTTAIRPARGYWCLKPGFSPLHAWTNRMLLSEDSMRGVQLQPALKAVVSHDRKGSTYSRRLSSANIDFLKWLYAHQPHAKSSVIVYLTFFTKIKCLLLHKEPVKETNPWLPQDESNYPDTQVSYKIENTSQTDEAVAAPQTKRGKRKCPTPELHCAVRRSKLHRGKISVPEYITKETKLVNESQAKIDEIIKDITSDESPVLTIRKLKNLKSKLASFGDFNDQANQDWISR